VRGFVGVSAVALGIAATMVPAQAEPGGLDPTYGIGGRVVVDASPASALGYDLAVLPDGSTVAVGYLGHSDEDGFAVKIGASGVVDQAFGLRRLDHDGGSEWASAVAVQPDGKIVAVGQTSKNNDGAVWRLLPSGAPDLSFSGDGFASVDSGAFESLYDVAIAPDGKIVVVGKTSVGGGEMAVYRLTPQGEPDPTFDHDGAIGFGGAGNDSAAAVLLQPDGKIVVTGYDTASQSLTVRRLTAGGAPDPAFGVAGTATVPGTFQQGLALALQPDGRILVAGQVHSGADYDAVVVRLDPTGGVDGTFGGPTGFHVGLGGDEAVYAIAVAPDGRVVGSGATSAGADAFVFRTNADGSPDQGLGPGGVLRVNGGPQWLGGATVQPDGRFLAVGDDGASRPRTVVYRFLAPGAPPTGSVPPICHGRAATIVGTDGNDRIAGTKKADVIVALGGNDVVKGLGGDDLVCAGDGHDKVSGGAGKDRLYGERGKDRLVGGSGKDRLVGGPDRDSTKQ
jgi:uncharacterized delta-60 repeat protein